MDKNFTNIDPTTFQAKLGSDTVEVGDARSAEFKPHVKLNKWGKEANLSISLADLEGGNLSTAQDILSLVKGDTGAKFYAKDPDDQNENGSLEFEISFAKRPTSDEIVFSIGTSNLDFHYQGALNTLVHPPNLDVGEVTETHLYDSKGTLLLHRPENVVGSYAVYHSSKRNNKYRAGKAFHIYRPEVVDDSGKRAWCTLSINKESGTLTITLPKEWMDKATYPVVLDPLIGSDSAGSTESAPQYYRAHANLFAATTGGDGILSAGYISAKQESASNHAKLYLYSHDGANSRPEAKLAGPFEITIDDTTKQWWGVDMSSPEVEIDNSTVYWGLFHVENSSYSTMYGDNVTPGRYYQAITYAGGPPNPWPNSGDTLYTQFHVSMYFEYTVPTTAAPTTTTPTTSVPTTSAPTTLAPTTSAPTTLAPTTLAPTTLAPTTAAPTTLAPTTAAPTTLAPTTVAPTTLAPTTLAPTTSAPTTLEPTTVAPTTTAPTTISPTTTTPTTLAPTTLSPTTLSPTTTAPTTIAPTTLAPTTSPPTTVAPTTLSPTTIAPTTITPTTLPPTTAQPTTTAPTTVQPTTLSPTTLPPTTSAPTTSAPTTLAPTTAPPTTIAPTTISPTTLEPTTSGPTTLAPTTACSVPVITSVTGTVVEGQTLTINGVCLSLDDDTDWTNGITVSKSHCEGATPTADGYGLQYSADVYSILKALFGTKSLKSVQTCDEGQCAGPGGTAGEHFYHTNYDAGTVTYIRLYINFNEDCGDLYSEANYTKMIFLWDTYETGNESFYIEPIPHGDWPEKMYMEIDKKGGGEYSGELDLPSQLEPDKWYCVEARCDTGNGELEVWVDGELVGVMYGDTGNNCDYICSIGFINSGIPGGASKDITATMHMDGFALSDSRIYPACMVEVSDNSVYGAGTLVKQRLVSVSDTEVQFELDLTGLSGCTFYTFVTSNPQDTSNGFEINSPCTTLAPTTSGPTTSGPTTVSPTTSAPTSLSPTTVISTTIAPSTSTPTTLLPTTVEPTTTAPTTILPTTVIPTTISPTTVVPTTLAPTTQEPTTIVPTTVVPTTVAPTTIIPTTLLPTTVIPTTSAPTTLEPTTTAPTTILPTTAEPTTVVPTTLLPTTTGPTTIVPTTVAPSTVPPTTAVPTTSAPTTISPTTVAPTTPVPTTVSPTTLAPTTSAPTTTVPTTLAPTTIVPTTSLPTTLAPTTTAPTTLVPTTISPTTPVPTTVAPTTVVPTTLAPTTSVPTTVAPTTTAPTTLVPTTLAPTTTVPTTLMPTTVAPTTAAPTTVSPTTAAPTTVLLTTAAPTTLAPTTKTLTTTPPTTVAPGTEAPVPVICTYEFSSLIIETIELDSLITDEIALDSLIIECETPSYPDIWF